MLPQHRRHSLDSVKYSLPQAMPDTSGTLGPHLSHHPLRQSRIPARPEATP